MDEKCALLWQKLSAALKPQVSADTFKRWFSAVQLVAVTDEALSFRVPNNIYQFWIESNHMPALNAAIMSTFGGPRTVLFNTSQAAGKPKEESIPEVTIGVVPAYRRQGIGSALLTALIAQARQQGVIALSLSVAKANPAQFLYQKLGFVPVRDDGDAWIMRVNLE